MMLRLSRATISFFHRIIDMTLGSVREVLVEMLPEVELAGLLVHNAREPITVVFEQDAG